MKDQEKTIHLIMDEMLDYYKGDSRRIFHFMKVYSFAKHIAVCEAVDAQTLFVLKLAALMHDIGIKNSEEKYGSSAGSYQEIEGPPIAEMILQKNKIDKEVIDRVCYLIGHHHTYTQIDGIDYQILVEADFIVNIDEDQMSKSATQAVMQKYFKTQTGLACLRHLYL